MAPRTSSQFAELRLQSREKIMQSALSLFAKKGYDNTSVSQIAKMAGVSKGLMYNYFNSKDDLVLALMTDAMKIAESMAKEMALAKTAQNKIRFVIEQSFSWIIEHEEYSKTLTQLALQVGKFPQVQQMVDARIDAWKSYFVEIFEELGFSNPEMEAYCFGALFDGMGQQYLSVGDKIGFERVKEFLIDKYCVKTLKNPL